MAHRKRIIPGKKFNGKLYNHLSTHVSKKAQDNNAKKWRKAGYLIRKHTVDSFGNKIYNLYIREDPNYYKKKR